jgi:hypothetical protein
MLMDPEEYRRVCVLRRVLNDMNPPDAMELLVNRLQKTKTNAEFLMSMNMKVSESLGRIALETGVPVAFGVLNVQHAGAGDPPRRRQPGQQRRGVRRGGPGDGKFIGEASVAYWGSPDDEIRPSPREILARAFFLQVISPTLPGRRLGSGRRIDLRDKSPAAL